MSLEHVSERFQRILGLHLYGNLVSAPRAGTPLILGIHGAPGEGKTFQCEVVFREIGAHIEYISGGELEHHTAGEPAARIRRAYQDAALHRAKDPGRRPPAVVFINDIDAGVGDWGSKVQYTVNRQNVFSELMHLADFPHDVNGRKVERVPIIVTANDMSKMYQPLTRLGRMAMFEWAPTGEERATALRRILPELGTADREKLVAEFPGQNIAFFSALRAKAADDSLWRNLGAYGLKESFQHLTERRVLPAEENVSLPELISIGQELVATMRTKNHLEH